MTTKVLVHHHIFKNAGSTVDFSLEKIFKSDFRILDGVPFDEIYKILTENKSIKAISSHHFHSHQFVLEGFEFLDIIFLRHPLDRFRSIYDFYKRAEQIDDPLAKIAQLMQPSDFFGYLVEYFPNQINNAQVNILANNGNYSKPPSINDYNKAIVKIENIALPGVVDWFDESIVTAEYFLRPCLGVLDWSYIVQNKTSGTADTIETRLDNFREECGSKLYNHLVAVNELDISLYEYAKTELLRRINYVPNFERKLADFKIKCLQMGGG